jgi:hypothetical protein
MTMPTSDGELNQEIPDVYRRQIEWYDSHAIRYRHWYLGLEAALLILAAITAVVTTIHLWGSGEVHDWMAYLPVVTSVAVVILAGILNLFSFQEHWLNYRVTCEKLRREARLLQARGDVYTSAPDPQRIFAERAESIIANENASWLDFAKKPGSAIH